MELKRVVVTGLGAITPIGNTVQDFWDGLVNGVSGAGDITHFDAKLFKTRFACEVKGFNATDYIDRKEARKMDLYTQFAVAVAKQAVADAGIDVDTVDRNRVGVVFGAGIGGIRTFEEEAGNYALRGQTDGPKFNPFFIPKMISDIAAGQITTRVLDITGQVRPLAEKCRLIYGFNLLNDLFDNLFNFLLRLGGHSGGGCCRR